jgi:Contractile injection system tape measure protein
MNNSKINIVQKQKINFHYKGKTDGFAMQKEITDWYYQELFPELQSMMDDTAPDNLYIKIDKLELDIFVKGTGDWKKTLRNQVLEGLGNKIRAELQKSNSTIQDNIVRPAGNFLMLLTYYLQNGFLPWWSSINTKNEFDNTLDEWLLSDDSRKYVDFLKGILSEYDVVFRIARFNEKFFFRFINYLSGSDSYVQELQQIKQDASVISELLMPEKKESINILLNKIILENVAEAGYDLGSIASTFANFLKLEFKDEFKKISTGLIRSELLRQQLFTLDKEKKYFTKGESSVPGKKETGTKKEESENITKQENESGLIEKDLTGKIDSKKSIDDKDSMLLRDDISIQKESTTQGKKILSNQDQKKFDISADVKDGIFVHNAGLVIVAGFLPMIFKKLSLINEANEIQDKNKAAMIVQYLASGNEIIEEFELGISKILCGLEMQTPVDTKTYFSDAERNEANELLLSVIEYWTILGNTSVEGLRNSFLKRNGKLSFNGKEWLLQVEQESYDMLLQHLPWNISMIKLPWMNYMLKTQWFN